MICLGCCCILAAAALSLYNIGIQNRAGAEAERLTASLTHLLQSAATPAPGDEFPGLDEALETEPDRPAGSAPLSVDVEGYSICGFVEMPTIGISLAVITDWSYANLNISACRYVGRPEEQMIIMAHNFDRHFGRISALAIGDSVRFTDAKGELFSYEVSALESRAGDELNKLLSGDDWDLTLFTCTYGGANRVVVRCTLAE